MNAPPKDHWQRLEALFLECLELDAEGRRARLDGESDRQLAAEVERMLAADAPPPASEVRPTPTDEPDTRASDRLLQVIETTAADLAAELPPPTFVGQQVGAYRLDEELGRGGMSTVYLARRTDRAFEHAVAIKFVRHGLASPTLGRRLMAERQILAHLDHPNIARLFDGGTTADGTPYFVMELIEGEAIDRYCDRHRLSIRSRIRLFRRVCEAVDYAHRNLVVHRDLKPSNVLVTEDGVPKLLDFGIAKLLDTSQVDLGTEGAEPTLSSLRMGTPGYASPEQVAGQPITTASDTYSLGILLYRLLVGARPFPLADATPIHEIEEAILERRPTLPSHGARQSEATVAERRQERPETLARRLRGDLDTILMMALRKEPERRYGSVRELSNDLLRHLAGHPVQARPDAFLYRTGKFVSRHRYAVGAGLAALLLTVSFVVMLVHQRAFAEQQQAFAEQQRARAEKVSATLVSLIEKAAPNMERGQTLTVRELLDLGREELAGLDGDPETQAQLRTTFGDIYEQLGLFDQAAELYGLVLEEHERRFGPRHPAVAEHLYLLGRAKARGGDLDSAEPLFRKALELRQELLGEDHPDVAVSLNSLALVLHEKGDYARSVPIYVQALARAERVLGPGDAQTVKTVANLALLQLDQGDHAEAERLFRQALEGYRRLPEMEDRIAEVLDGLAQTLHFLGHQEEAEARAREALDLRRRLYGEEHPEVARSLAHLALTLLPKSPSEADEQARKALELRQGRLGFPHAETAESFAILAAIELASGDTASAEALYHQAIQAYSGSLGQAHPITLRPVAELGILLAEANECQGAVPLLDRAEIGLPERDPRMPGVRRAAEACTGKT